MDQPPSDGTWPGPLFEQFRAMELRRGEAVPHACTVPMRAWSYGGWAARSGEGGELLLEQLRAMEQRRGEAVQRRLARAPAPPPAPRALPLQGSALGAWWSAGWVAGLLAQSQAMAQRRGEAAVEAGGYGRAQARRHWQHGGRVVPEPMPGGWAGVCEGALVQCLVQENWDEGRAQAASAAAGAAGAAGELQRQLRQRRRRRMMQRRRQRRRGPGSAEADLAVASTGGAAPATGALGADAVGQDKAVAGRKGACEVPAECAARRLSGRSRRVRAVKPRRARIRAASAAGMAAATAAKAAAAALAIANMALLVHISGG